MSTFLINSLFLLLPLAVNEVSCACGGKEYVVGQECCPMCRPGYHVRRHCTDIYTTRCAPCSYLRFTDKHNGQEACSPCSVCDSSAGVRVKRNCSSISDTLCEPLEGHYCTDPIKDGCQGVVEHTKCLPGQYIKQLGTASTDTVCEDCASGSYANGSFPSCRPHTQCEAMGLYVLKAGSSSQDTECGTRGNSVGIIVGVVTIVQLVGVGAGGVIFFLRKRALTVKYERKIADGISAQASQDPEVPVEDQQPDVQNGLTGVT